MSWLRADLSKATYIPSGSLLSCKLVVMDWIMSPQNPHVEALNLNVTGIWDMAFMEVINIQWSQQGGD